MRHIRAASPFRILDFGCGPGRDLAAFRALGHESIGLEGSPVLAAMAREHSGCEVWEQDFLALKLPAGYFDGIFANASLFHVPCQQLPRVLRELNATLRPDGVLFTSNPRGDNKEGWNQGRYGAYHDLESWRAFVESAAFSEREHYSHGLQACGVRSVNQVISNKGMQLTRQNHTALAYARPSRFCCAVDARRYF